MSVGSPNDGGHMLWIPTLLITVPANGNCLEGLCGKVNQHLSPSDPNCNKCSLMPRYAEWEIDSAVKNKTCQSDQFSVTNSGNGGMVLGHSENQYPTECTFTDKACAERVCGLVQSRINATDDGKSWTCYSDPVLAQAAANGKYWFATTNETWPCKDAAPSCKDIKGREFGYRSTAGGFGFRSHAVGDSRSLLLLVASTATAAVLGACGITAI